MVDLKGLLLIVTKDEERTFWLLKMLIKNITNGYYNKSMVGLIKDLAVLKRLLLQRAPQLYYHIDNLGMTLTTVTTKWFVCMFAEVLPVETTLRIWDCLFLEGRKVTASFHFMFRRRTSDISLELDTFKSPACIKYLTKLNSPNFFRYYFVCQSHYLCSTKTLYWLVTR